MKNLWMSAWLSAANAAGGTARNHVLAEISKTQTKMFEDWYKACSDAWLAMWFPTFFAPEKTKNRKRR